MSLRLGLRGGSLPPSSTFGGALVALLVKLALAPKGSELNIRVRVAAADGGGSGLHKSGDPMPRRELRTCCSRKVRGAEVKRDCRSLRLRGRMSRRKRSARVRRRSTDSL